jgi:hypothetical protein
MDEKPQFPVLEFFQLGEHGRIRLLIGVPLCRPGIGCREASNRKENYGEPAASPSRTGALSKRRLCRPDRFHNYTCRRDE